MDLVLDFRSHEGEEWKRLTSSQAAKIVSKKGFEAAPAKLTMNDDEIQDIFGLYASE